MSGVPSLEAYTRWKSAMRDVREAVDAGRDAYAPAAALEAAARALEAEGVAL